jgi:hypothetical protein
VLPPPVSFALERNARPAVYPHLETTTQRPDWLAGHARLELRNVVARYPFERAHGFPGIQPNSGHRDYSRLSCAAGETQLGPNARMSAGMLAGVGRSLRGQESARLLPIQR